MECWVDFLDIGGVLLFVFGCCEDGFYFILIFDEVVDVEGVLVFEEVVVYVCDVIFVWVVELVGDICVCIDFLCFEV